MAASVYLLDTNAIIEAVRTACWSAISGGLRIVTVARCEEECLRGDRLSSGYIAVTPRDLARMTAIHRVQDNEVAALLLLPAAAALDDGERDLFAHALGRSNDRWLICSPDRASVRLAGALAWQDRLISLGEIARIVGVRPNPALRPHFETAWLSEQRTIALLNLP